jgi:hypothetical protein
MKNIHSPSASLKPKSTINTRKRINIYHWSHFFFLLEQRNNYELFLFDEIIFVAMNGVGEFSKT